MKTLILGSSGKIGKFFLRKDNNFIYTYHKNKIPGGIKFDLTKGNLKKIFNKYKINKTIILSAYSDPDYCYLNKKKSFFLNVTSTKKIIDELVKKNIYFIFFSSEFVYDGNKKNYSEKKSTKTFSIYGKQKLIIENYVKKKTDNFAIFRIAKTYSKYLNEKDFVSNFFYLIKKKKYKFNAAYDQIFNPLYINDLIKITNFFLKKEIKGIFNIGGSKAYSRYACLKILKNLLPTKLKKKIVIKKIQLNSIKWPERRPLNLSLNVNKLKKTCKFKINKFENVANGTFVKYFI